MPFLASSAFVELRALFLPVIFCVHLQLNGSKKSACFLVIHYSCIMLQSGPFIFPFRVRLENAQFDTLNSGIMLPVHMLNVSVKCMAIIHIRYALLCF